MEETGRNEHSRKVTCPRSQRVSSCLSQTQNPACRQKKKKKASEEKWRWKVDQIKKKTKQNNKSLPPGNNAGRQISTQIQTKHLPSVRLSIPALC